ncbi:MAG: DUF5916 domain-containing protein [candidate division Zixibacteria bacterium]
MLFQPCRIGLSSILVFLTFSIVAGQESADNADEVREVKAYRVNPHPPKIDGFLDDNVWNTDEIEITSGFLQRLPDDGVAATESTSVAVVYDDDAIYFALWNFDSEPDNIVKQMVRRDRIGLADNISIIMDPYHDHQTGVEFCISSVNVQVDRIYYNDSWSDHSWNGVWESAVQIQPWGWSAEIKIPYHCLRFTEKDVHTWGINFSRWIYRKMEDVYWSHWPLSETGFISHSGHLTGLTEITPSKHLEIMPFAVSSSELKPSTPGNDGKDYYGNTGVDIKYGVTSNLTLDATINPDFGQVELDAPVLNLSAFETWYPERRPFFIEGMDLFRTDFQLFYSRRIGRQPRGWISDTLKIYETNRPDATSIIGAAKLTGKLANGTSLAFLTAQTAEETEEYAIGYTDTVGYDANGDPIPEYIETGRPTEVIEPSANYSVMRLKQDIFNNSYVGIMFTNTAQDTRYPVNTGGFDWRLNTNNNAWHTTGQIVYSRVHGQKTGFGFGGEIEKASGEHWRGGIYLNVKDPYLDLNHLGRLNTNGTRSGSVWIGYREDNPQWIIRRMSHNFNTHVGWTYDDYNYSRNTNYNFYMQFLNFWSMDGGISLDAIDYDPWETRGNGNWELPDNKTYNWWAGLNSDSRKKLSFSIHPEGGSRRSGNWWSNYLGVVYRAASNIQISVGANYSKTTSQLRWVENAEYKRDTDTILVPVFGKMDQTSFRPRVTFTYVPSPSLSIQFSAQTLISALNHNDFSVYGGGQDYNYDHSVLSDTVDYEVINGESIPISRREMNRRDNRFNHSSINSTLIMRWEYRPGSTLYLVWTRSRLERDYTTGEFDMSRDVNRFFKGNDNNLFLIKASYWWNI